MRLRFIVSLMFEPAIYYLMCKCVNVRVCKLTAKLKEGDENDTEGGLSRISYNVNFLNYDFVTLFIFEIFT